MTKKIVIIDNCNDCPHFDSEYFTYRQKCTELERLIPGDEQDHIPTDCPLKDAEE